MSDIGERALKEVIEAMETRHCETATEPVSVILTHEQIRVLTMYTKEHGIPIEKGFKLLTVAGLNVIREADFIDMRPKSLKDTWTECSLTTEKHRLKCSKLQMHCMNEYQEAMMGREWKPHVGFAMSLGHDKSTDIGTQVLNHVCKPKGDKR